MNLETLRQPQEDLIATLFENKEISSVDKHWLTSAQAAAGIINALNNYQSIDIKAELIEIDDNGNLTEAKSYLDEPKVKPIQRIEHLARIFAVALPQDHIVLKQLRNCARNYIVLAARHTTDAKAARKLEEIVATIKPSKDISTCAKDAIAQTAIDIIPRIKQGLSCKEQVVAITLIAKRAFQVVSVSW